MEVRRLLQIELDCFHSFFEMVHIHALNLLVLISGPIKPKGFPAHNGSVNRIIVGADILVIFRDRALLGYADDSQREGGALKRWSMFATPWLSSLPFTQYFFRNAKRIKREGELQSPGSPWAPLPEKH